MLQASRSTGNARETMKPLVIKRSTLFRARDTCSSFRRLDSRITLSDIRDKPVNKINKAAKGNSRLRVKGENGKSSVRARNLNGGYRSPESGKFDRQINGNVATTANEGAREVLEKSESKIHLKSGQVLEDFESFRYWKWKVDEGPNRSTAVSKLRNLRQERTDLFRELRSSLEKMLNVVRHVKNQQSR